MLPGAAAGASLPPDCWAEAPVAIRPSGGETTPSFKDDAGRNYVLADVGRPWQEEGAPGWLGAVIAGGADHLVANPVAGGPDRYGEVRAQLVVTDRAGRDVWVQEAAVRAGLAVVMPDVFASPCIAALMPAEADARRARRGLWADEAVPQLAAGGGDLGAAAGRFALVTGTVLSTGRTRQSVYLNFGRDYRTDFTVLVALEDLDAWPETARDVDRLVGRGVRVRGLIEAWNGGLIRVEHPAQIEVLGPGGD